MEKIKIGKNVIENLTTAMYTDSRIVFREYIQNSVDQIDKAKQMSMFKGETLYIDIEIDQSLRNIIIKDNATGIESANVEKYLANIADSYKDRDKDKGFRGIGRLGGLAYCDNLRFITSSFGETKKSVMSWDAKLCRRLIFDKEIRDSAEEILKQVIKIETGPCSKEEHYFIVELNGIRQDNSDLLDTQKVKDYISDNAPVGYSSKFIFSSKIYQYASESDVRIDEYDIRVNGDDVYKNYGTVLYEKTNGHKRRYDELYELEFKEFRNDKDELLAWMWFGISGFLKQIPEVGNPMRGLRLRKGNIQVGNGNTLVPRFKEPRGNFYFVGEIHVTHNEIIPNARRDYFIENQTLKAFEAKLEMFFAHTLHKLYYNASRTKNLLKREREYIKAKEALRLKDEQGFISNDENKEMTIKVEKAKVENEKAKKELNKIKKKAEDDPSFKRVIDVLQKQHEEDLRELNKDPAEGSDKVKEQEVGFTEEDKSNKTVSYIVDELSTLDRKERNLVKKIYGIIQRNLPEEVSSELIRTIHDGLRPK